MRRLLDQLSFRKNRYARPNQDWICGHADGGHPCPLGPDARGRCRHTGECFPAKSGDRWLCTRRDAQGGVCAEGPLPNGQCAHPIPPCQPRPSLRRMRGRLTWLLVALTLGGLLFVLAGKGRRKWISPGDLSVHHATSGTECADCHSPEEADSSSLTRLAGFQKRATQDSQLCLKCHSLGSSPFDAHGAPASALAVFTERAKAEKSNPPLLLRAGSAIAALKEMKSGELACSTCHQEHHGKDFNIAHLSQTQCQVCHRVQFASLANGHPEFANYPYQRRTRIYFDHASHIRDHFPASREKAPNSCQACHLPAVAGGTMVVKDFEQACAACHTDNINRSSPVAFFRVPGVDVTSLARAGLSIGQWPKDADDEITPFMNFLFASDPVTRQAVETYKGKDLRDLRSATPEQLAAASKLAWAVKEFLYDFEEQGQSYLTKRLQAELPPGQTDIQLAALTGGIPRRAGLVSWHKEKIFPDLRREVPDYRRGVLPPVPKVPPAPPSAPASAPTPSAKTKQPPSDADILGGDEPAKAPSPSSKSAAAPPPGDDILGGGESTNLGPAPAKPTASTTPGDDILGGGEAAAPAPSPTKANAAAPPGDDILGGGDLATASATASKNSGSEAGRSRRRRRALAAAAPLQKTAEATPSSSPAPATEFVGDEAWTATGWFRTADGFTLSYRPSGHADPFLVAWFNAATAVPSLGQGILKNLAMATGPGACAKCHTVDQIPNQGLRVNWTAARPKPNTHGFTKFSHTAHLSLMTERGCQTCHVLNPSSTYATFFQPADPSSPSDNRDPSHFFQSNFVSLPKQQCSSCHTPRIAGDDCLLCHNYHTGTFATDMSKVARIHPLAAPEPK